MSPRWPAYILIVVCALAGCDRGADDGSAVDVDGRPVTTRAADGSGGDPTTTSPASTSPATTQAVESLIDIDGTLVLFPAAKLRVDESDGNVVVRLFSDDPKGAALDEDYEGNSFYLQIDVLDAEDAKDLDGVVLTYRAPTSERDDSPYGIFLEGRRWALQPENVRVTFEGTGSPLDVRLAGTFLMFDSKDPTAKPRRTNISAELSAIRVRK